MANPDTGGTRRRLLCSLGASVFGALVLLLLPERAEAANPLHLPLWSVAPFALLLLGIALLPLVARHFWESNRNKGLVSLGLALPTSVLLFVHQWTTGEDTLHPLGHALGDYASFILLVGALYTVSGGILVRGDILPRPTVNAAFLGLGCVLANFLGTTGASVLLIRPLLRINRHRRHVKHIPVFFIFTVSNLGGLLTPLGDPPLFLGFLQGVPFAWTLRLWPQWLLANGLALAMFLVWDGVAFKREGPEARDAELMGKDVLRLSGKRNLVFLAGIIAAVLVQRALDPPWGQIASGAALFVLALLSWIFTRPSLRLANAFHWAPIIEVAVVFAGIFVTMVPALAILQESRAALGVDRPWQYFWLTGGLSSFLDNAPTYSAFATMAAGGVDFGRLAADQVPGLDGPLVLAAISCGAVFMGANTYIGNGPNFMVKAIAEEAGYPTPSFMGYLAYSVGILLPIFVLITLVFFRPM
ncbi:MAG: sodium:proton antiporter [Gemmataceae bacterium]